MDKNQTLPDLLDLLDVADRAPGAAELRLRTYELLGAAAGLRAVDVRCGGRAVRELDERGVRAIGVDSDERMIDLARGRYAAGDFRVADAYELPFGDGTLHGYRADKVFHALEDPVRALAEARRVLAPGGRAVLLGQDWDTVVIDADDARLTRAIVHARADLVANPRAPRRCRNLLLDAGFREVTAEVRTAVFTDAEMLPVAAGSAEAVYAAGGIGREAADTWIAEQRERARTGRLFVAVPMFLAAGTAPGR